MADILVADDDAVTRDLVARTLTSAGHRVVTAGDGQEAIDRITAASTKPALVVADIDMPLIDGVTLAGLVQSTAPATKILLISGHADGQARTHALPSGVAYLAKPFTMEALKAAIRGLIG
jgi:CheY-like chemotaxis protein